MKLSLTKSEIVRFERVRGIRTEYFIIKKIDASTNCSRVAFGFSRKVGNAVERNRFKRRIRALVASSTVLNDVMVIAIKSLSAIDLKQWEVQRDKICHILSH